MKTEGYILIKLKTSPFVASFIIGHYEGREKGALKVKSCATIHYLVSQEEGGKVSVRPSFLVNSLESEGTWEISEYEILSWRFVDETDGTFKLYEETMSRYRVEKAGLALPPQTQEPASPMV